jgi:hypothetical protein
MTCQSSPPRAATRVCLDTFAPFGRPVGNAVHADTGTHTMLEEFDVERDVLAPDLARVIDDLAASRLIEIDVAQPGVDRRQPESA